MCSSDGADLELLGSLENFFSSPSLTTAMGAFFLGTHVSELEFVPLTDEQPLK
jgi:hypothetical protein